MGGQYKTTDGAQGQPKWFWGGGSRWNWKYQTAVGGRGKGVQLLSHRLLRALDGQSPHLPSLISCLLSLVHRLSSPIPHSLSPVSHLSSLFSHLPPPDSISCLLSPASCLLYPGSRLLSPVSCLMSSVSHLTAIKRP